MRRFRFESNRRWTCWALAAIVALALILRTAGLFRGLETGSMFHPDEPKQVVALWNYLEGRYIWYTGSLFYDGYPLGLNHVDEWLLRPVFAAGTWLRDLIRPDVEASGEINRLDLFHWGRSLRVAYGLCTLLMAYALARGLWPGRGTALAVALLLALAPLSAVVTHSATGDIGTDLFTAAALLLLGLHVWRSRRLWLGAAALAVGLAFSCKYNGALAGLVLALYVLFQGLLDRQWKTVLTSSLVSAAGFLAGFVVGTPALLINRHRTWKDIYANFKFLRDYDASDAFLARPFWEKWYLALTANTPAIVGVLGGVLAVLAAAGLVLAVRAYVRALRSPVLSAEGRRTAALTLALMAFPFAALVPALAGKPEVQPFHFSFIQLPLTLAAVYALRELWLRPGWRGRAVAGLLFAAAVIEFGHGAEREFFFWRRSDNLWWKECWPSTVFGPGFASADPAGAIKSVYLEPCGRAVFRNRAGVVRGPDAGFWNRIHEAAVPSVPGAIDPDWIFPNGPVFPRNDRMFKVDHDAVTTRQVVFHAGPGEVTFGLRSGSWPVSVTLDYGGRRQTLALPPNEQHRLKATPCRWRQSPGNAAFPQGSYIVPLTVRTETGPVWVTVMTDDREVRLFDLFGGRVVDRAMLRPEDIPTAETIERTRNMPYLEGRGVWEASADETEEPCRFPEEGLALPCGPYVLRCEIRAISGEAEATVRFNDFYGCDELASPAGSFRLHEGLQVVTSRFSKVFAPYHGRVEVRCVNGRCRIERWTVVPDTARIRDDLQRWAGGAGTPDWLGRGAGPAREAKGPRLGFGGRIRLTDLEFPAHLNPVEPIQVFCAMELDRYGWRGFDEQFVFVHLLDHAGHTVRDVHFSLARAAALGHLNRPIAWDKPIDLPAGEYGLELGLYNSRTEKRMSVEGAVLTPRERNKRMHVFGKTTVMPPGAGAAGSPP